MLKRMLLVAGFIFVAGTSVNAETVIKPPTGKWGWTIDVYTHESVQNKTMCIWKRLGIYRTTYGQDGKCPSPGLTG